MYVSKLSRFLTVGILLAITSLACGFPGVTNEVVQDSDVVVATRVAATMAAGIVAEVPEEAALPPAASEVELPPATTATITQTPTETLTPTPSIPMVSVTVNTNCRFGPGQVYEYLGALLEGETAEIHGRNPEGNFWYIENPDQPGSYCWITAAYAQVSGDTSQVPELTPPPTPTDTPVPFNFNLDAPVSFDCGGDFFVAFRLTNTGGQRLQSFYLTVRDEEASLTIPMTANSFFSSPGCSFSTVDSVEPGEVAFLQVGGYTDDPVGHTVHATAEICSENDLSGTCAEKTITRVVTGVPSHISDAAMKENRDPVDERQVLDSLLEIPIETWNYIAEPDENRHMGPMAQDFFQAYGLGADDRLSAIDVQGVALASIQALHEIVQEKDAQIVELEARLTELEGRVTAEAPAGVRYLSLAAGFLVGASLVIALGWIWTRRRLQEP
jgi:hypothetical protein